MKAHEDTRFNPRFGHTTQVPYVPVEAPTKSRVFFNPNPPLFDHLGQEEVTYSTKLNERVIQTS